MTELAPGDVDEQRVASAQLHQTQGCGFKRREVRRCCNKEESSRERAKAIQLIYMDGRACSRSCVTELPRFRCGHGPDSSKVLACGVLHVTASSHANFPIFPSLLEPVTPDRPISHDYHMTRKPAPA